MRKWTRILILSLVVFGNISVEICTDPLKAVFILFRHGERNPRITYPNDPYKDHDWPGGFGALTQVGIRQMYDMGVKFRARYSCLIPNDSVYSQRRIRVNSSAAERCLMSGQSFLAGFLPPNKEKNILPIKWQPVPIHSIPMEQDHMLAGHRPCRKFERIDSKLFDLYGPKVKEIVKENLTVFYEMFNKNIGRKVKNLRDLTNIADNFEVILQQGRTLPDWVQPIYNTTITDLVALTRTVAQPSHSYRTNAGALMNEVFNFFASVKNHLPMKIFINSAHDFTIDFLTTVMEITSQVPHWPDLGAAISMELIENTKIKNDVEIRILYFHNSNDTNPINIKIPNCPAPCPLRKFYLFMEPKIIKDIHKECDLY